MVRLDILYRDESLAVVFKPSGMLVHRGWGRDRVTLVDLVRAELDVGKVHPIGRLDRGASGVSLFALDTETARTLEGDADASPTRRSYLALVRGETPDKGVIEHPIERKPGGPKVDATTSFRRLDSRNTEPRSTSLVEARPLTGRLHQVRRHLKHIDHPLIGDANYGKGALNRAMADRYGLDRLALHALEISFDHPRSAKRVVVRANLPADLREPLAEMGYAAHVYSAT